MIAPSRYLCLVVLCGLMLCIPRLAWAQPLAVPDDDQLRQLVGESLLDFNDSIQKKDFTAFRSKASKILATKMSADDMLKAFDDFVKKDVNIEGVRDVAPIFSPGPHVDENGVLLVSGNYPTTPYRVLFTLKYLSEHSDGKDQWKLVGLAVDVKKIPLPAEEELRKMTTQTILDFNAGVRAKNFNVFLATTAKPFRDQFTSEKLLEAFKDFIEKDVDLSPVKTVDPIFDKQPTFSDDKPNNDSTWQLSLDGHYPTPDAQVYFSLRYLPEGNGWRLISIDVNTKKSE